MCRAGDVYDIFALTNKNYPDILLQVQPYFALLCKNNTI